MVSTDQMFIKSNAFHVIVYLWIVWFCNIKEVLHYSCSITLLCHLQLTNEIVMLVKNAAHSNHCSTTGISKSMDIYPAG